MARQVTLLFPVSNTQALLSIVVSGGGATASIPLNNPYPFVFDGLARTITLTSADNLSAVNFTITGTDQFGNSSTEVLAGPNANTVTSVNQYHTIINISSSANYTHFSIGSGSTGTFQWFKVDNNNIDFQLSIACIVSGTINYSVNVTYDQLEKYVTAGPTFTYVVDNTPGSFPVSVNLTNASTTQTANILYPVTAVQTVVNSSTGGSLIIDYLQQGIR